MPDEVVAALRAAGCVFAEEEAALLRAEAATPEDLTRMVAERVAGAPLEQVVGWAEFCGLRIRVAPDVFVPRRRTAYLVELAARHVRPGSMVVDLCCGSGAIAAALAAAEPGASVYAADVDPAAVACARENLAPERVFEGDLYAALPDALRGRVDVLVANPPYVPEEEIALMPFEAREQEPRSALGGGADGLDIVRPVVEAAPDWLAPAGVLVVETSARQAANALTLFESVGFSARIASDPDQAATAVVGELRR